MWSISGDFDLVLREVTCLFWEIVVNSFINLFLFVCILLKFPQRLLLKMYDNCDVSICGTTFIMVYSILVIFVVD